MRLPRLMIKLQRYDFEMIHTPGKYLSIPDTLSIAGIKQVNCQDNAVSIEVQSQVDLICAGLQVTDPVLDSIVQATSQDEEIQSVLRKLQTDTCTWKDKDKCFSYRQELSEMNGMLMRGDRIVIPAAMRKEILDRLHDGHLGLEKTKALARRSLFWEICPKILIICWGIVKHV